MGFTLGDSDGMLDFMLGGYGFNSINGIRPFYGYDFMNIYGNSYIKGRVGVDVEVYRKNHLNFYANYANIGNNIFEDRKSTRLNSSHVKISYAVFCLKKKKKN